MQDEGLKLLTHQERSLTDGDKLPPVGFIDDFKAWAGRKTDAPEYSLTSAALIALSCAAGDLVTLPGFFSSDPTYLNLYVMLVGPSTVLRKTTVLGYVRDLLPKIGDKQEITQVLDDVSPQALNRTMAEAGATMTPVLMHLDEVAGVFEVQKRQGSYLKGLDKILMKAYDHSPIHVLRARAEIDVPQGAFVSIFSASTPDPLMEVLESGDVESGLLPRFLIFDARDANRGERRSLMARAEDAEWEEDKERLQAFLADISKARVLQLIQPEYRTIIPFTEDALTRLDQLDAVLYKEAGRDATALGAIKGRAFWHVVKLSGLYAISRDGLEAQVEIHDVLRAMRLVEETLQDLAAMSDEVGANRLERRMGEVKDLLLKANNATLAQSTIAKTLKLDWREAADVLRTLQLRGEVTVNKEKKTWTLN